MWLAQAKRRSPLGSQVSVTEEEQEEFCTYWKGASQVALLRLLLMPTDRVHVRSSVRRQRGCSGLE